MSASVAYNLTSQAASVTKLTLTAATAGGTGNALANIIHAQNGVTNTGLDGKGAIDSYYVDTADTITASGTDATGDMIYANGSFNMQTNVTTTTGVSSLVLQGSGTATEIGRASCRERV